MENIEISKVVIGERFRNVEIGDCQDLKASMELRKQLQAILLQRGTNELVAGMRRLTTAKALGWTHIGFEYTDEVDPIVLKIMELEENLCRKDFTPEEKAKATLELHRLMEKKYGKNAFGKSNWTLQQTADKLGVNVAETHMHVRVAEALEKDATLGAPLKKGISVAYKEMLRKQQNEVVKFVSERVANNPLINQDMVTLVDSILFQGDCLELIKGLANESIDHIHTDSPYGVDLQQVKTNKDGSAFAGAVYKEDSAEGYHQLIKSLAPELYRVLKPNGFAFLWLSYLQFQFLKETMEGVGFKFCNPPFIWFKEGGAHPCYAPATSFAGATDFAMLFRKGNPMMVQQGKDNFMSVEPIPEIAKIHPLERPLELLEPLLSIFCLPGHVILDTFAGSFSLGRAALNLGMKPIGFELDTNNYHASRLGMIKWANENKK